MRKIQVEFHDFNNGATSPIDVIEVDDNYTEQDYIDDCINLDDESWREFFENGEVIFVEIEE